jgi:hypothetical protein
VAEVFAEMKSRPSGDQLGEGPMAWNRLKKTDGNVMAGIWDFVCNILFFFKVLLFFSWEMAMVGLDARIHSVYPD